VYEVDHSLSLAPTLAGVGAPSAIMSGRNVDAATITTPTSHELRLATLSI
jgi:hypothetical protein